MSEGTIGYRHSTRAGEAMRRHLITALFAAVSAGYFTSGHQARAADTVPVVRTVVLPRAGWHFALHPETGALVATETNANRVVLYPKAVADGITTGSINVAVAAQPTAVV